MYLEDFNNSDPGFFKILNQNSENLSNSEKWNQNPPLVFLQNKFISIHPVLCDWMWGLLPKGIVFEVLFKTKVVVGWS